MRQRIGVLATVLFAVVTAAPAAGTAVIVPAAAYRCTGADLPVSSTSVMKLRAAVLCLVNRQRVQRGLPALRDSPALDRSAQRWTNWMVGHHRFTHGHNFSARITAAGYGSWAWAGENIASGFPTPNAVMTAWMASREHCRNILAPQFRDIGIGVSPRPVYRGVGAGTWTQDFARRSSDPPLSSNTGPQRGCPYHVRLARSDIADMAG